MSAPCSQCGAAAGEDGCLASFHALLAFENENPPAFGAAHHLTVPAFYLQHPAGYGPEILEVWRTVIADSLDHGTPARDIRAAMGRLFNGATRVRSDTAVLPAWWPARWSMNVGDVIHPGDTPDVDAYVRRALEWARAVRDDLAGADMREVSAPRASARRR